MLPSSNPAYLLLCFIILLICILCSEGSRILYIYGPAVHWNSVVIKLYDRLLSDDFGTVQISLMKWILDGQNVLFGSDKTNCQKLNCRRFIIIVRFYHVQQLLSLVHWSVVNILHSSMR